MHRPRLAVGAVALVAALALAAAAQAHGPQPGALELPGKRTATSSTYLNRDGSYTTVVAPQAVNYRDVSGEWQPIDTTLVSSSTAGYAFQNAAGPFRASFKDGAGDGFVRFGLRAQLPGRRRPDDLDCRRTGCGVRDVVHQRAVPDTRRRSDVDRRRRRLDLRGRRPVRPFCDPGRRDDQRRGARPALQRR